MLELWRWRGTLISCSDMKSLGAILVDPVDFSTAIVGPGSPSQSAAEKIKREALGTVGREISGMKASLTDDMWRISESLNRYKSGRVDPQMLQFRRMMKEVEGGTIANLPAEWQPLGRTLRSLYDQIGQIIKRTPGLDQIELITNYVSHYWNSRVTSSLSFFEVLALLEMVGHPLLGEPIKLASCVWE
jgi:hypothetical protein